MSFAWGDTLTIELETDSLSTFLWYNGDTTSFDSIWVASSNYWVVETNICGADTDTFRLATVTDPVAFIGSDTGMCVSDSVVLDASTPFGSYVWQNASSDSIFGVGASLLVPGSNYFHVTVTNACGTNRDTILIEADLALQIHLGKDDTACVDDTILFSVPEFSELLTNGPSQEPISVLIVRIWIPLIFLPKPEKQRVMAVRK